MEKKIGELTLKEITNMKCLSSDCSSCPFGNYDNDALADKLCELVNSRDEFHLLEQEIEVDKE